MTINDMRVALLASCPNAGMGFRQKVATMCTAQVIAIYKSIQEREAKHKKQKRQDEEFHQMDIFEYMVTNPERDAAETHTQIAL